MRASPELERFIRQTLGCGCPDSVFESVMIHHEPLEASRPDPACWIEIGGRLLIAVCRYDAELAGRLAEVFGSARARRDGDGFNRFRLVVADAPAGAAELLDRAFAPLGAADDRLHLHLVAAAELPPLTDTETATA